jgi:molecular chaperone DnaJ
MSSIAPAGTVFQDEPITGKDDLYMLLEVERQATVNDIKRAFRKLARRFHPDINPGDRHAEERFKRITEAYEVLSDPLKREFYDVNGFYTEGVLETHDGQASWGFSFQGFNFSRTGNLDFSDIFGHAVRSRRDPERGEDLEHAVSIGFEDSLSGRKTRINVGRMAACPDCGGTGQAPVSHETACPGCGGSGKATRVKGHLQFAVTCGDCGGTGRSIRRCGNCGGEGRVAHSEAVDVDLLPGVATGTRLRVPGKGNAGRFGGPPGDLYVVIHVAEHPFFKRIGDNIHCAVPLTVTEAALGTKIEVPTIDGPAMVRIHPGTQPGQSLRIRGRGAPSLLNPGLRGDQYVEVKVTVPRVADERSKQILKELANLNPDNPRSNLWW